MFPKNDQDYQWQQLFLAPSCSPIPWGNNKREASISQALGLQLGVTARCEIEHVGSKNQAWHTELSCVSQDCQFSRLHSEKEKQKTKQQRKCFSMVQPGAEQMCRSRQPNSATRGVGCLPQADWKKCLNRVCCGDVTHPVLQGTTSTRPLPRVPTSSWQLMLGSVKPSFFLPLPVSSSHCRR